MVAALGQYSGSHPCATGRLRADSELCSYLRTTVSFISPFYFVRARLYPIPTSIFMITETVRLILFQLFALLLVLSISLTAATIYFGNILLVGTLFVAYIITLLAFYKAYQLFITLLAPFPIKQEAVEPSLHCGG